MLTGDMLRRSAYRFPRKPAILWNGTSLSYRDLDARSNQLAHALLGLGLKSGAKVAVLSRNRPEYGIVFFGTSRTGYVLVNVSVLYAPEELSFVLDKADAEVLIFEDLFAEKVGAVRAKLPKLQHFVVIGEPKADATPFAAFIEAQPTDEPAVKISEHDPFCMTYTGGTTGRPKGVLCSHRNRAVTAHTVMVEEAIDERDVVGIVTPMFHVAALNIMFQPAILAGATTTMLSKWVVDDFARMARDTKMTAAFMVPTQVNMVVSDPAFDAANYASWRKLSFAGAPMPDWVQREMLKKLREVKLTQIFGQSEIGVVSVLRHWYLPDKLGSVGRQAYNVDVRVVDKNGVPVKPGEVGEVVSRGDNVMLEYYNEPEQTKAFFRHGWGWTGDLATIDEDGFITLVDRSKDMIISGGENIYPKEIENVLYEVEAVAEAAVFGIPDDHFGEVPAAYVKLKAGARVTESELVEHCAGKLARFKRPRLIKFVDDFPKTPIGKIQKNVLREPYWANREKKI
ncbi:MAG TPA: long-chain-fatty-acid--CoA ligase [Alphaproteobacteria bacterium]|nr:long-chain-fatty-acid--CoA ligase [Alphaproteobacteria bacterium]